MQQFQSAVEWMICYIFHEDPYFSWIHRYAISYFVYWGNRKNEGKKSKEVTIKEVQMANLWELTMLNVCLYIHYGCCMSRLQSLQNAGNRMLFLLQSFFIILFIHFMDFLLKHFLCAFRKAFKIFMADYDYSTCISYSFAALPTAQYNPSPILTNYYSIVCTA